MRVSSLVLIGIVSGIVASGVMLALLMHSGRVALVTTHHPAPGSVSQPGSELAASGVVISLEHELQAQARRLDELAGAFERLDTGFRVGGDRRVRRGQADVGASPSSVSMGSLVGAGFSEAEAEGVMALVEATELEQMEQRFAMRQGQAGHGSGLSELAAGRPPSPSPIRAAIVERFGEPGFDRFLYATGQPNRIQVSSVMHDSRAQQAGFEPGDVIVEVAGEAVYSNRDLYRVSVAGEPGDLVPITVARGTVHVELYVGRGPLGVQTDRVSVRPG